MIRRGLSSSLLSYADSLGNVNPFCPGVSYARNPSPAGFQLVPSISDSFCQAAIPRVRNRTASQLWLDPQATGPETESSPSIWSIEELLGVPVPEIGGDGDPFQAIRFADLARDLSIVPEVRRSSGRGALSCAGIVPMYMLTTRPLHRFALEFVGWRGDSYSYGRCRADPLRCQYWHNCSAKRVVDVKG